MKSLSTEDQIIIIRLYVDMVGWTRVFPVKRKTVIDRNKTGEDETL